MSLSIVVIIVGAIFLAIGLIGGGIRIGVKEGEASIPTLSTTTRLLAFIIGAGFILFGIWQELNPQVPISLTKVPTETQPAQPNEDVFTYDFDGSNGSFDSNAWICGAGSCSAQNVFQQNGNLVFNFTNSEIASETWGAFLKSEATWKMQNLVSIQARLQIGPITKGGTWLGLNDSSACALFAKPDIDTPFVHCDLNTEYTTGDLQVEFDTWYTLRIEYDSVTQELKYYLEDELIGRNKPKNSPDLTAVAIGAWREQNQSVAAFIDSIVVKIRP